jgi:hypothetical protein
MAKEIKTSRVDSSMVDEVGYDADSETLRLVFKGSGQTWDYSEVPESVYKKLVNAPSIGKAFNSDIKGIYYGHKV